MKGPATLIYTHGGGRLGNQLIRLAHWLAWTRVHPGKVRVIDMGFWRYAKYFRYWSDNPGSAFPDSSRCANWMAALSEIIPERFRTRAEWKLQPLAHAAGRYWPAGGAIALNDAKEESFDLDDPAFLRDIMSRRVTTCSGWKIASWRLVAEQQAELREYFRPSPRWQKAASAFVTDLRRKYDLVIGVQIRQSDYRTWNEGRFYFPTNRYVAWIRQLLDLHAGRRVAIVVASEEPQDPDLFAGLPVYFATGSVNAGGPWFESWVELSLCDLVLSPPSTFSTTAAYLGNVPLWPVSSADQNLELGQLMPDPLLDASRHAAFSLCVQ